MRYAVSVSSMLFLALLGGVAEARGPAGGARGERPANDRPAKEQRPANERSVAKPEWLRARAERVGAPSGQRVERSTVARDVTKESSVREASVPLRAAGAFTRTARVAITESNNKAGARSGGPQAGGTQQGGTQQGGAQTGNGAVRQGGAGQSGERLRQIVREKQRCPANDVLCGAHRDNLDQPSGTGAGAGHAGTVDLAKEAPADGGLLKLATPFSKARETFRTDTVRKLLCNKADGGFCSR